jgi:hypothetical protein
VSWRANNEQNSLPSEIVRGAKDAPLPSHGSYPHAKTARGAPQDDTQLKGKMPGMDLDTIHTGRSAGLEDKFQTELDKSGVGARVNAGNLAKG